MVNTKQIVIDFYLDWVNCWLTPEAMATYYDMTTEQCEELINLGRKWYEENHNYCKEF